MYSIGNIDTNSIRIEFKTRLEQFKARLKANIEDELDPDMLDIECSCCYSSKPIEDFVRCPQDHMICSQCVQIHSSNMIFQNGSSNIKCICMDFECGEFYSDKILQKILPLKTFETYSKIKAKKEMEYIFTMEGINLTKCQFCETYWDLNPDEKILACRECKKSTCLECNQLEHKDRPCDKIRLKIEEGLTREKFLVCNSCSRCIFKEDGCNAVRCPCGNNMCWGCKRNWGSTDAHGCTCGIQQTNHLGEFAGNTKAQMYINRLR